MLLGEISLLLGKRLIIRVTTLAQINELPQGIDPHAKEIAGNHPINRQAPVLQTPRFVLRKASTTFTVRCCKGYSWRRPVRPPSGLGRQLMEESSVEKGANATINRSLRLLSQTYGYAVSSDPPKARPRIVRESLGAHFACQTGSRAGKRLPAGLEPRHLDLRSNSRLTPVAAVR